jgi:hypothetical protein
MSIGPQDTINFLRDCGEVLYCRGRAAGLVGAVALD